jgi:hypothetical protein
VHFNDTSYLSTRKFNSTATNVVMAVICKLSCLHHPELAQLAKGKNPVEHAMVSTSFLFFLSRIKVLWLPVQQRHCKYEFLLIKNFMALLEKYPE